MPQHMFQDPAGTIPAILPGQPVGLVIRQAGLQDATQATALSKPTLARWPKTGRRNLANYAQDTGFLLAWPNNRTESGLTYTKLGVGLEDGFAYVDYEVSGIATIAGTKAVYDGNRTEMRIPTSVGAGTFRARLQAKVLEGSSPISLSNGIRIDLSVRNAGNQELSNATSGYARASEYTELSAAKNIVEPDAASIGVKIGFRCAQDEDIGTVRFRIRRLEAVHGDTYGAFQSNFGPNDITEAGVPDQWHLYNDGGDSLNAVYPAGTYGRVTVGIDRVPVFDTFVSDGTTPVNTLRHERQIYHNARLGVFSETEMSALRKWIQEKL